MSNFFQKKHRTKNLILARFRGLVSLNLVLLDSQTSPLSISFTYLAAGPPHGTCQGLRPWTCFCALRVHMVEIALMKKSHIGLFSYFPKSVLGTLNFEMNPFAE